MLPGLLVFAVVSWRRGAAAACVGATAAGFALAAALLAADARDEALRSQLRHLLDADVPGFALKAIRIEGTPTPIESRLRLLEDAAVFDDGVALRAAVLAVRLGDGWSEAGHETVRITVGGAMSPETADAWRAGRTLVAPVTYRRPARFLNEGVPDFERELALDGTVLLGSVKSALLVDLLHEGTAASEMAARVRAHVRSAVATCVGVHDAVAGAVVTAVLIGDRTGLPEDVRSRLQAAGTYHVIAISGGNIAILAAVILGGLWAIGIRGRPAATLTIVLLGAYACIVTTGPSVWRATLMAGLYLAARALDHRTPAWHALAIVAGGMTLASPLAIRDPGFILTFGATVALLEGGRRALRVLPHRPSADSRSARLGRAAYRWVAASVLASMSVELVLAPISAQLFSRVTAAGVLLNLISVPAMSVVQVAGLLVCLPLPDACARAAGWLAAVAAAALLESARLVEVMPALARRVPPPGWILLAAYYLALGVACAGRGWLRAPAVLAVVIAASAIATGRPVQGARAADAAASQLRLTMFDVGQAEAVLLETPAAEPLLVDAAGIPFGDSGLDVGARVLGPALWSVGVRRLGAVILTHGDPDHIGGGLSVVRDFAPSRLWTGVPVPLHAPSRELDDAGAAHGAVRESLRRGATRFWGAGIVRILHPPEPDWERQRVRNDDSIVIEVRFGDVVVLLTGDIGADVERELIPRISPGQVRILKVAHHGSRTSSSAALLEAWRPQIALISCGRNNTFGHPAPEVLARLEAIGARIYRTDLDGQIVLTTDGKRGALRTWSGRSYAW